jgi:competence protein ComEC
MGDLEADGEHALLQSWRTELEAARHEILILKVGHHGSRTSSTPAFLAAVDAELALVSAGRANRYGHPARETLQQLRARECVVLRTDVGGAIRIEQRGATLWVQRPGRRAAHVDVRRDVHPAAPVDAPGPPP